MRIQSYTARSFSDLDVVYKESDVKELYEYHQNQIAQLEQEVKELKAHNKTLEGALISICDEGISFDFEDVNEILEQSPEQSLAQHDNDLKKETILHFEQWLRESANNARDNGFTEHADGIDNLLDEHFNQYVDEQLQEQDNDT